MKATERRAKKTRLKREAILRSAAAAFRRKGYYGTSMEDISEQLLMTKGSLYYYFHDKEEILFACHDYSLGLVLERLYAVQKTEMSPSERLKALIQGLVDVMIDELQGSALALDFSALSEPLLAKIIKKRDEFERGMRAIIVDGVRSGDFRKADAKLATFFILGAINWISRWYRPEGTFQAKEIGKVYGEIFLAGLAHGTLGR